MKINPSSLTFGAHALVLASVTGCGAPPPEADEQSEGEPLYGWVEHAVGQTYWNTSEGQGATIEVCWTANAVQGRDTNGVSLAGTPYPGIANARAWMKEWVEDSWGRVANLFFVGWGNTCVASPNGLDGDARVLNQGKIMFAFHPTSAQTWNTDIDGKSPVAGTMIRIHPLSTTKASYQYPSIHEMGHALGFAHEQTRPDNWKNGQPTTCTGLAPGEGVMANGDYFTSFIDTQSIMCYSGPNTTLSPGDIMGVQRLYGRKPTGSLAGFHGMCANISGGSTANGGVIGAWPCTGGWNDTWFRPNNSFENLRTPTNSRCLNLSGGLVPGQVGAWDCGNFTNERFIIGNAFTEGAEFRALGNLCVQMSGSQMQVAVCNASTSQRWDLQHPTGSIRIDQIRYLGATNKCLTTQTTNGAIAEALTTATCSSTDTKQRFTYPGQGIIKMANNPNLCLNVSGGIPTPGSVIGLWSGCDNVPRFQNEQFMLRGRVRVQNACMGFQSQAQVGDLVEVRACSGSNTTTQVWDYWL